MAESEYPLSAIPLETKIKAFNTVKKEFEFGEGEAVHILTEDQRTKALEFAKNSFAKDEPVNMGSGMIWNKEIENSWLNTFLHNISFMVVHKTTGEVLGFRITTLQRSDDNYLRGDIKDEGFRRYCEYMQHCENKTKFFEKIPVKQVFHFYGLGVAEKYRRQGLATKMVRMAIKFVSSLGVKSFVIKGEASSIFSKKVYEKCGFTALSDTPFGECVVDGKVQIDLNSIHKSMKILYLKVENGNA